MANASSSPSHRNTDTPRTRRAIIYRLKELGELDAQALAEYINISAMAVRQHLYALQDEGVVTYREAARPMGRPAKLWCLTPEANQFFPEGYAELTLSLIQSLTATFGEEGLNQLLEVRTQQQTIAYKNRMAKCATWQERTQMLAALRTEEGYMAEVISQPDGSMLLVEKHCPICAVATTCTGLCAQELAVFQAVLGDGVTVERTEHLIVGSRRCAYLVLPVLLLSKDEPILSEIH